MVAETDASKLKGWSYHVTSEHLVVACEWPPDFADMQGQENAEHINYKALWVVLRCVLE